MTSTQRRSYRCFAVFLILVACASWRIDLLPLGFTEQGRSNRLPSVIAQLDQLPNRSCSCYNSTASNKPCCSRLYMGGHKFGYELSTKLFSTVPGVQFSLLNVNLLHYNEDYRHVVFARNMYDAVVSGYLYHQSGRECWLGLNGEPINLMLFRNWETFISFDEPYPPANNRSICTYLANESEQDGMRVYIDVALSKYYAKLLPYWNEVQHRIARGVDKTLFVCLENVQDPAKQRLEFQTMVNWLYPGGHRFRLSAKPKAYTGAHATSHDDTIRRRLVALAQQMDHTIFKNSLMAIQEAFQCGVLD